MRIEDLRIGDLVVELGKPNRVYKVISLAVVNNTDVHVVDVETETEAQMFSADELELAEPRYKLNGWSYDENEDVYTATTSDILDTEYYIGPCGRRWELFYEHDRIETTYKSVEEAKEAAEKHFNELMEKLIKEVTE